MRIIPQARAIITPEFKDAVRKLISAKAKRYLERSSHNIRLNQEMKMITCPLTEDGWDALATKLRNLKYASYDFNGTVFVAETQDIRLVRERKVSISRYRGKVCSKEVTPAKIYELGPYRIQIDAKDIYVGSMAVHMIPVRAPEINCRHPHHTLRNGSHNTCWGGFGGVVGSAMSDLDFPEMYRYLYLFLERYNPSSPLIVGGAENAEFRQIWENR